MKQISPKAKSESSPKPPALRQLSPETIALLEEYFWCDFSDMIPSLSWEKQKPEN